MDITAPRATLTTEAISALLQGALDHARSLDKSVHVAVMDHTARLVGFVGSDAAPRICAQVAQDKAYTAVSMRMPTGAFKAMLDVVAPGEREIFLRQDGYIAAEGGEPVIIDGMVVGGVGVSGGGQAEDAACARAAARGPGARWLSAGGPPEGEVDVPRRCRRRRRRPTPGTLLSMAGGRPR